MKNANVKTSKPAKSRRSGPTPEEIAEMRNQKFEENREILRSAHAVAVEAFGPQPTVDMVIAASQLLERGIEPEGIPPLVRGAILQARAIGAKEGEDATSVAIEVLDVLLEDDQAEDHLRDALGEAKSLFGPAPTAETVLSVYFQIYGENEDFA